MSALPLRPAETTALDTEPRRPMGVYDSWLTVGAASVLACGALAACVWISTHLHADAELRTVALFAHLAALVMGFGAVLAVDYHALLWLTGRCTLRDVLDVTTRLHVPIWAGLLGLVASGVVLHPQLDAPLTRVKLACVVLLTLNGLQAGRLGKRMAAAAPNRGPLGWAAGTAVVSQICWWTPTLVGFHTSQG